MHTPDPPSAQDVRRCQEALNSLHSTIYFAPDLAGALAGYGITDDMGGYLVGRAAALGPAGPGVVTALFYSFEHGMVAGHLPGAWERITPAQVWEERLRAADATLHRALGAGTLTGPRVREAARLALAAATGGRREGRPMFAALADLPVPHKPHLVLWYAATLLREHRGDSHIGALAAAGLDGLEALVSHCASAAGMPREMVMTKRGWTEEDWSAAEDRLRGRGLMTADGALTARGEELRAALEDETDRRDRAPYEHLGTRGVVRLTELCEGFARSAAAAGIFPPPLVDFFVPGGGRTPAETLA
ncbi:SCO6745 family protein [Streptomyces brasiliscabiei]|uniref:SCO6745 family protein n=1 Tax=Streptomyces brasiliscabiei TaxID=2736302 RepID=UPI001C124CFD|nr:hypothetical protein [Streptomyces brasiliscabiei]